MSDLPSEATKHPVTQSQAIDNQETAAQNANAQNANAQNTGAQNTEHAKEASSPTEKPLVEIRSTADYLKTHQVEKLGDVDPSPVIVINHTEESSSSKESEADAAFRRWKDILTHSTVLVLVTTVMTSSIVMLHSKTASEQDKEGARTIVTAIIGAAVGYAFGKDSST